MAAIPGAFEVDMMVDAALADFLLGEPIPVVDHPVHGFITVHGDLPCAGEAVHVTHNDLMQIYYQEAHQYNQALHHWRMANPPERYNIDMKRIAEGRSQYPESRNELKIRNVIYRNGPGVVTPDQILVMIRDLENHI